MAQPRLRRLIGGLTVALLLVVVAGVGALGVRWWQDRHRSDLERALGYAPEDSARFSWTDWAGVRRELDADVGADSSPAEVEAFLAEGFDADLTSTSSLVDSTAVLQSKFGFSPAVVDWELLSQGTDGSVATMHLPDSVDLDALADTLEELGYRRPGSKEGVWTGGEDVLARLAGDISPQFNNLGLDADRQLVLASDSETFLRDAVGALDSGDSEHGLDGVADVIGDPLSAALYTGDQACRALAMSQADDADQAAADQLIAAAGEVNPMTGFAMAAEPDGEVLVAMSFESEEQARRNADSRARLASGPAPGQGGDFSDRFELGDVTADGDVVTMHLRPTPDSYVLSDLSTGPVLFATC